MSCTERLAYIYLVEHSVIEATQLMRASLIRLLNHYQIDPKKYHEILTQAWVLAVRYFMSQTQQASNADDFIDQHQQLLDSKIMLTHYSNEVLFSDQARLQFVEPDLQWIPAV
ncbi:MAG: hypothetical protein WAQ53_07270 [Thiofilum sp.]|uniref:hypothetical protein n=1 Tax=Thiofilum sp. TaxID=2212733 RepID=UPI0025CDD65F|nr:hypothetical protein [Thiofilum sp.]MBK8455171.1 hypothetical protein [Thiofilum sp.]